jgi:GAF domain-containing protein
LESAIAIASTGDGPAVRKLLEGMVAVHRRMRGLIRTVYESSHIGSLLEGAITLTEADSGNVQLRDLRNGRLRIATQSGFDSEFLEYFAVVDDDTSACGRAASRGAPVVIYDVNEDAAFAPHREIAAASRFRGVQSTPLVDPSGRLTGIISTHFRDPHYPSGRDGQLMQWYAQEVGEALAHQQKRLTTLYDASARLHAQTAELQDFSATLMHEDARLLLANGNKPESLVRQEWARVAENRAQRERERTLAPMQRARSHQGIRGLR